MNLASAYISTDEELEAMRIIRNAGREHMTLDLAETTVEEQRRWWDQWRRAQRKNFQALVYRADNFIVGYGTLTRRFGKLFVSLAVHPDHRGRGYGKEIYRDLVERAGEPVYAEIRTDNKASLSAASAAGFVAQHSVLVMKAG